MNIGIRTHNKASLRVEYAECLPAEMRDMTREIIRLYSEDKRKGNATALLHTVCAEADKWWITLLVQPHKFDDGMDDEKLVPFYERFGFVVFQEEPCVLMARSPQLPRIVVTH